MIDIAPFIREALITDVSISVLLAEWNNEPAVFTKRPIPGDSLYPAIVISQDIAVTDFDALTSRRQTVVRDLAVYGKQPDQYRVVEQLGYMVRELFHRNKAILGTVDGHNVVEITAAGPISAPTSDETIAGRIVTLTISLQEV